MLLQEKRYPKTIYKSKKYPRHPKIIADIYIPETRMYIEFSEDSDEIFRKKEIAEKLNLRWKSFTTLGEFNTWYYRKRNYRLEPIIYGEKLPKDELYYVYIECNYSRIETADYFNTSEQIVKDNLELYRFIKDINNRFKNYQKNCQAKYGFKNIFEDKRYIQKRTKEKLGVYNPSLLPEVAEKRKLTNLERYGTTTASKCEKIKKKTLKTMQERFGGNAPICNDKVKNKIKQTNLIKYGVEYIGKSREIQNKIKKTCLEKYGVSSVMETSLFREKSKQTCMEKYGVESIGKVKEIQDRAKNTVLERYGTENPFSSTEIQKKIRHTMVEKYGVEYPCQSPELQKKIHETMKKNNSYRKSKPEELIFQLLQVKFENVDRQHREDRYPYLCDFYIPELDLFIEYQGHQAHGPHPFNPKSKEDMKRLKLWQERAKEKLKGGNGRTTQYTGHIRQWTKTDPKKREIARKNGLNWIEFFSLDEFMNWYDKLGKI